MEIFQTLFVAAFIFMTVFSITSAYCSATTDESSFKTVRKQDASGLTIANVYSSNIQDGGGRQVEHSRLDNRESPEYFGQPVYTRTYPSYASSHHYNNQPGLGSLLNGKMVFG